jgi:hypothetical protein
MGLLTVIAKNHWDKIGQQIAALWLLQDSNGHDMSQGIIWLTERWIGIFIEIKIIDIDFEIL